MEKSWKVFFNTLLCIVLLFLRVDGLIHTKIEKPVIDQQTNLYYHSYQMDKGKSNSYSDYTNMYIEHFKIRPSKKQDKESKRVNFLILGVEGGLRTDTIIFVSFHMKTKEIDMISIPRDTYFYEKGYERGDQRKINAKYGRSRDKGSKEAIEKILGTNIHHHVSVDFEGVEEIVNIIGGVEVDVPCDMLLDEIEIAKGRQVLNGKQAIKLVRFRKKYSNGDLGRIKMQQQFIKSAMKKSFSLNLPKVIKKSFKYVKTDMTVKDILYYSLKARNMKVDDISMRTLPGVPRYKEVGGKWWSYYFYDKKKMKETMKEIYNIRYINERSTKKLMLE